MKNFTRINLSISIIILVYALVLFFLDEKKNSILPNDQVLILLCFILSNHFLYAKNISNTHPLLSLDIIFMIGIVSMCFSIPIMDTIGVQKFDPYLTKNFPLLYYYKSLVLSLIAISSFSCGFMLSRSSTTSIIKNNKNTSWRETTQYFLIPGTILLLYFLIFSGKHYISGSYGLVHSVEEKYQVPFYISQILLTLTAISIAIRSKRIRHYFSLKNILYLFPYYVLILILAIHGDRGTLIVCISPLLYIFFSHTPKRFTTLSLIIGIGIALLILGSLRTARNQDKRGLSTIIDATSQIPMSENLILSATNIGGSGLILASAMEYQEKNGMTMGRFTLNALIGIIPYSRRFLYNANILPKWKFSQSADLLTHHILGPHSTSGVGTTTVADFYLEFGWIGVLAGHFLIGWSAGYIQAKGESTGAEQDKKMLYIFSIGVFAIMPRYAAISTFVKLIGYAFIAILLVHTITRISRITRNHNKFQSKKNQ